jgi:hypothetical protein
LNIDSDHLVMAIDKLSARRLDVELTLNAKAEESRFAESAELLIRFAISHVFTLNHPSSKVPFQSNSTSNSHGTRILLFRTRKVMCGRPQQNSYPNFASIN